MKMNWKKTLFASLVSAQLLCGAAEAWTFAEMPHRTALDWNPQEGSACECAIDFEILSRLAKREVPAETSSIRLAARTPKGETALPFSLSTTAIFSHSGHNPCASSKAEYVFPDPAHPWMANLILVCFFDETLNCIIVNHFLWWLYIIKIKGI